MITIFEVGTISFTTHGLGDLPDAIVCEISRGINSSEYDLYMEYPDDGVNAEYLVERRILYVDVDDARHAQPFDIYDITQQIGKLIVKAEHVFHRMIGVPIAPFALLGYAQLPAAIGTYAMVAHSFSLQLLYTPAGTYQNKEVKDLYHMLGGSEGSVLQKAGCEYDYDGFTVKLCRQLGNDNGVTVSFGQNMKDLAHEVNVQEIYTGAVCKWASEDGDEVHSDVVYRQDAADFPYQKIVVVDKTGDYVEKPAKATLDDAAAAYVAANLTDTADLTCTVDFLPFYQQAEQYAYLKSLEQVSLGDAIQVEYITGNREIVSKARIVRTVFDAVAMRYSALEIGNVRSTLGDYLTARVGDIKDDVAGQLTEFERIVEENTALITGSEGGHIVLMRNADGTPEELLILDTPSVATANTVARFNKDGIAFSTHGINGPYETAILLNGSMTAPFMNTIRLNAQQIVAGVLQIMNGQREVLYVDVDNGVVRIDADSFCVTSGGVTKTIQDIVYDETADERTAIEANRTQIQLKAEASEVQARFADVDNTISNLPTQWNADLNIKANEISATVSALQTQVDDNGREIENLQYTKTYVKENGLYVEDSEHDSKSRIDGSGLYVLGKANDETLLQATSDGVTAKQLTTKTSFRVETSQKNLDLRQWFSTTDNEYGIAFFVTDAA